MTRFWNNLHQLRPKYKDLENWNFWEQ